MLVVQISGSGKSEVPQTVGSITYGLMFIIENNIYLSANTLKEANGL